MLNGISFMLDTKSHGVKNSLCIKKTKHKTESSKFYETLTNQKKYYVAKKSPVTYGLDNFKKEKTVGLVVIKEI